MTCRWCNLGYIKLDNAHLHPHNPYEDAAQEKPVYQCQQMENDKCLKKNKLNS